MIETNVICDRCGRKCEGTTYYTLDIWAYDIDKNKPGVSTETASQNLETHMRKSEYGDKHYCSGCMSAFKFLLNGNDMVKSI